MKASFFSPETVFFASYNIYRKKATGGNFWRDYDDCKRIDRYEIANQEWYSKRDTQMVERKKKCLTLGFGYYLTNLKNSCLVMVLIFFVIDALIN
jgi:hypothetical protein